MKSVKIFFIIFCVLGFGFGRLPVANGAAGSTANGKKLNKSSSSIIIQIPSSSDKTSSKTQAGLSKQRFEEYRYGISFAQPAGTKRILQTSDDALAKYIFPGHGSVSMGFYIRHQHNTINLNFSKGKKPDISASKNKHNKKKLTVSAIKKEAIGQFSFAYPSARRVKAKSKIKPAGRPGALVYFVVTDKKGGDWVAGQAFMLIDPHTVAMFQMQCDVDKFDKTRRIFEALIKSIKMMSPKKLDSIRHKRITAANDWLATIETKKIKTLIKSSMQDRWYRIVRGGKDVGYKRIYASEDKDMGKSGFGVTVQTRLKAGKSTYDSLDQYFASFDKSTEMWSRRTEKKSKDNHKTNLPQAGALPTNANWAETGIRSKQIINVSRQTPLRIRKYHWSKPVNKDGKPLPYVTQAGMKVILGLLPHKKNGEFAFYAYDSKLIKISLHLLWVQPLDNDKFQIIMRPAADRAPIVLVYSNDGKLLDKNLTDGKILKTATKKQMRKTWNISK